MGFISTGGWANGRVPYEIHFPFGTSPSSPHQIVLAGIGLWNNLTPPRFVNLVQRTNEPDFVQFVPGTLGGGFFSKIGKQGGPQDIVCDLPSPNPTFAPVQVAHEIGHAVGLLHEHQRPDRDLHIQVTGPPGVPLNPHVAILPALAPPPATFVGQVGPYDCNSIMHYPPGNNFGATFALLPGGAGCASFGGATGPSPGDIQAVRALYDSRPGSVHRIAIPFKATGTHLFNRGSARRKALRRRRNKRNAVRAFADQQPGRPKGVYENPLFQSREESGVPFFFHVKYELRSMFVVWYF